MIITTVAFREPYVTHSANQMEKLKDFAVLHFTDALPYKEGVVKKGIVERFQKSLYGFKPHAIQRARDMGHKKVVWLDPSVLPVTGVQVLFDNLDDILVQTGRDNIRKMANDKAINYFCRADLDDVQHVGGTIYGFNFDNPKAVEVFDLWKKAEEDGIYGNQDEFMAGHWADEACLALAMHKVGVAQKFPKFKFKNQKE